MYGLVTVSYSDNLSKLLELKQWLINNTLYTKGSRLECIIERMEKITNYFHSNRMQDLIDEEGNINLWYTLTESSSFIEIYEMVRHLNINYLPRRAIKNALRGPYLPMDELPGDENVNYRNILFELELASKLYKRKINIIGFEDIQFLFENHHFYVQCKRLFSKKNVLHNIKSAQKQLIRNINTTNDRGIIALSIDKILGLDGMMLKVQNENEIQDKIYSLVNDFIITYNPLWIEDIHPQTVGIILVTKFLTHILDKNLLSSCFFITIVPLCPPTNQDTAMLRHLAKTISP